MGAMHSRFPASKSTWDSLRLRRAALAKLASLSAHHKRKPQFWLRRLRDNNPALPVRFQSVRWRIEVALKNSITLILARAVWKERYAERLLPRCRALGLCATAQALDNEMRERIAHHSGGAGMAGKP